MTAIFGHDRQMQALRSAADHNKLHHGWIFAGPKGLGKAGFAMNAARWMLGNTAQSDALIAAGTHPDLKILRRLAKDADEDGKVSEEDLKKNISIDQIRALQRQMTTKPAMEGRRIVIIDAIDDLESGGANALLKSLEEPPVGTIFLCISHAPDRLLPTLRSRCQILRFEPLSPDAMRAALRQKLEDAEDDDLENLIAIGQGIPGRALALSDLRMHELDAALAQIAATGDSDLAIRNTLAATLSLKAANARYEAFIRRVPAFLTERATRTAPQDLAPVLSAFEAAEALQAKALPLNMDKSAAVLELANIVATLAKMPAR